MIELLNCDSTSITDSQSLILNNWILVKNASENANLGSGFACGFLPCLTQVRIPYRSCNSNWISSFSKTLGHRYPYFGDPFKWSRRRGKDASSPLLWRPWGSQCTSGSTSRWLHSLRAAATPSGEGDLWTTLSDGDGCRSGRLSGVRVPERVGGSCIFIINVTLDWCSSGKFNYVYPDIPRFLFCFVFYFYKMASLFFKTPRTWKWVHFDSSLSFIPNIQSVDESHRYYLWNFIDMYLFLFLPWHYLRRSLHFHLLTYCKYFPKLSALCPLVLLSILNTNVSLSFYNTTLIMSFFLINFRGSHSMN